MSVDRGSSTEGDARAGRSSLLHGAIADRLRSEVLEGTLPERSKLPAIREIAARFDVSTMTVRRAIRTLEQEGHVYRIPAVGVFVRHPPDRPAATKDMVTFVATDLFSPFEVALARGIKKACRQHGWEVQIFEGDSDAPGGHLSPLRGAASSSRGAIVMPTCTPQSTSELRQLQRAGLPVVLVDRAVPGLNADLVESDHEAAAYQATAHLIERGHACIRMVTPPPGVLSEQARIRGYEQALRDAGIEPAEDWLILTDPQTVVADDRQSRRWWSAYQAILPVLGSFKRPCAVFAHNACSGWGVYKACEKLGLRIPEDVSVVCVDDSDIARAMRPSMTAVAQRTDEIGRVAVDLLMQRIRSGATAAGPSRVFTHCVIEVDLIERQSVAGVNPASS